MLTVYSDSTFKSFKQEICQRIITTDNNVEQPVDFANVKVITSGGSKRLKAAIPIREESLWLHVLEQLCCGAITNLNVTMTRPPPLQLEESTDDSIAPSSSSSVVYKRPSSSSIPSTDSTGRRRIVLDPSDHPAPAPNAAWDHWIAVLQDCYPPCSDCQRKRQKDMICWLDHRTRQFWCITNAGLTLWAGKVAAHEALVDEPPRCVMDNPYHCRRSRAAAPSSGDADHATGSFTNNPHHPTSSQRLPLPPSPQVGMASLRPTPSPLSFSVRAQSCYAQTQHEPRGPSMTAKAYCERWQPDARELLAPLLARRIIYMGSLRRQLLAGELDQDLDEWQRMELDNWISHWSTLPDVPNSPSITTSIASPQLLRDASQRGNRQRRSISPLSASEKQYSPSTAAQMFDDDPENRAPVLYMGEGDSDDAE